MTHPLSEELRKAATDPYPNLPHEQRDLFRRAADALDAAEVDVAAYMDNRDEWKQHYFDALARVERIENERDELRRQLDAAYVKLNTMKEQAEDAQQHLERAEAQTARYREALEAIAKGRAWYQLHNNPDIAADALREPATGYTTCGHVVKVEGCMQCALNGPTI